MPKKVSATPAELLKRVQDDPTHTTLSDRELLELHETLEHQMYQDSASKLYPFFVNFWQCHDPSKLHTSWVQQCLCEHIEAALKRQIRRLVINIPPRSGKSIISISSICWHWLQKPQEKFWLVSHSEKLYMQNILLTRRIMEHPLYKNRWMNTADQENFKYSLTKDVNTKTRVENSEGGYILGGSPTSKALGIGYSVALLDDVLDSEESNSPDAVAKVNDWYTQTFLNRSNDVNTDVQIIIMQRLHENDICDYVNSRYGEQGWFNLVLPARFDEKRIFTSPIGFNDPRKYHNQLLDPVRLPDSFLVAQAKNALIYNTRYQQDPGTSGDGNLVQKEWIVETTALPKTYDRMITVWDLSFDDAPTSSYSVGLVIGYGESKFYIIDMVRKQMAVPDQVDSIRHLRDKYPGSQIAIEKRANGSAALSLLEREIHNIYSFQPRLFGGSKEQRLSAVLPYMRDKQVIYYSPLDHDATDHTEPSYAFSEISRELLGFPIAGTDDIVDCIAYGVQWLAQFGQETTTMVTNGQQILLPDLLAQSTIDLRFEAPKESTDDFNYQIFGDVMSKDYINTLF